MFRFHGHLYSPVSQILREFIFTDISTDNKRIIASIFLQFQERLAEIFVVAVMFARRLNTKNVVVYIIIMGNVMTV